MRRRSLPLIPFLLLGVAMAIISAPPAIAQQATTTTAVSFPPDAAQRFHDLIPQIIAQSNLKAGQSVVISGAAAYMPFMEDVAVQLTRRGVSTYLDVQTDKLAIARRAGAEGHYGYLPPSQVDRALSNNIDLFIVFPGWAGPGEMPPLSAEEQAAVTSSATPWTNFPGGRRLNINIPMEHDTTGTGLSFADVSRYRWDAIEADYSRIGQVGESLQKILSNAKTVRVTSPHGTDITFSVVPNSGNVDVLSSLMNDPRRLPTRNVAIPGGHYRASVVSSSANGKIRAPLDQCNVAVHDEAIDVRQGVPESVHAATDEACVQKGLSGLRLSSFFIGLNPGLGEINKHSAMPYEVGGEGNVGLWFGADWAFGGTDHSPAVWWIAIPKATVTVDGKPIVRDGQIVTSM